MEATDQVKKQVTKLRAGRPDQVRFFALIGVDDKGTANEPLKYLRSLEVTKAKLAYKEAFNKVCRIIAYASPRDKISADEFFDHLGKLIDRMVSRGVGWQQIDRAVSAILRNVSARSRYHVSEDSDSAYDHSTFAPTSQLGQEISDLIADGAQPPGKRGRDPNDRDPKNPKKPKADGAETKVVRAKGVAAGDKVPVPDKDSQALKDFVATHGTRNRPKKGGGSKEMRPCWNFHHPQGCSFGDKCQYHHEE